MTSPRFVHSERMQHLNPLPPGERHLANRKEFPRPSRPQSHIWFALAGVGVVTCCLSQGQVVGPRSHPVCCPGGRSACLAPCEESFPGETRSSLAFPPFRRPVWPLRVSQSPEPATQLSLATRAGQGGPSCREEPNLDRKSVV